MYIVADYAKELGDCFSIDVSSDQEDIHPLHFCHSCRRAVGHRAGDTPMTPSEHRVYVWEKHSATECMVRNSYKDITLEEIVRFASTAVVSNLEEAKQLGKAELVGQGQETL